MISIKDHNQLDLFDPWSFLTPKRRKLLEESWAGLFKQEILCVLPVNKLAPYFNVGFGRPTKELHTVLGVLVLQQTHDLTDEEAVNQLAFNIQWHYALNITEESDGAKYIAPKTLWNMRSVIIENELESAIFENITDKLASVFNVDTDKQRLDSVHIKSNMRKLGRISIFSSGINKFLVNLKRNQRGHFETIDERVVATYLPEKSLACFSMVKPSESQKTLESVSADLFDLLQKFKADAEVTRMYSYKQLERILNEQCNVNESGDKKPFELKPPKEIPSDSLQNPSDPDATYSGHKGQGYQVQIMETYTDNDDEEERSKALNLITHVEVEKASQSDAQALIPAIESTKERCICPKEITADSLYGSDDNHETAIKMGVELVSPVMGKPKEDKLGLADFVFTETGHIKSCPQGHTPQISKKKKSRYTQGFCSDTCVKCPVVEDCPVKPGKKYYYLRYEEKAMRIAKRRANEQTDAFKDRYRWRAGVEATMSEYDKVTGVKRLRVRGLKAVRFAATLKAIGVNILRAVAVRKARDRGAALGKTGLLAQKNTFLTFKEHFVTTLSDLKHMFHQTTRNFGQRLKMAT